MSTYSSISSLLIEDQPYVIMKEEKLLPVYFFFFFLEWLDEFTLGIQ